jgi:hypothetical protein
MVVVHGTMYKVHWEDITTISKGLVLLQWLAFSLPVIDVLHDRLRRRFGRILPSDTLNEITIGVYHNVSFLR